MTTYPAISLHQPYATLIATRKSPCACGGKRYIVERENGGFAVPCICTEFVKRFETRSRPCPPKYIGQRVAIHAAKTERACWEWDGHTAVLTPLAEQAGATLRSVALRGYETKNGYRSAPYVERLPLGAVVATAVITASLPIVGAHHQRSEVTDYVQRSSDIGLTRVHVEPGIGRSVTGISDQLPYGDWAPNRFAWALAAVEPLEVPVPWKGRQGFFTVELP